MVRNFCLNASGILTTVGFQINYYISKANRCLTYSKMKHNLDLYIPNVSQLDENKK